MIGLGKGSGRKAITRQWFEQAFCRTKRRQDISPDTGESTYAHRGELLSPQSFHLSPLRLPTPPAPS